MLSLPRYQAPPTPISLTEAAPRPNPKPFSVVAPKALPAILYRHFFRSLNRF